MNQHADIKNICPRRLNEMSVLAPLLAIYTSTYLALTIADFFMKSALELPDGLQPLYIALVGAYAADKEIRRWLGVPEPPRRGTVFVYLWLLLFLAFYLVVTFQPKYRLPPYLLPVCLQVLGIFFGSKTSKYLHGRHISQTTDEISTIRQQQVLELARNNGSVTRQMVADTLGISSTSAFRVLAEMEATGQLKRVGEGRGARYVPTEAKTLQ